MTRLPRLATALLALGCAFALSCGGDPVLPAEPDAGAGADAGLQADAGAPPVDSGAEQRDATSAADAARPDSARVDGAVAALDATSADAGAELDAGAGADAAPAVDAAANADAAATADASPTHGLPAPMVLLHLSDIHFGSGSFAIPAFELAQAEIIPTVDPLLTFATGDLVETGNNTESWQAYREHIDGSSLTHQSYIEVAGNHDIYLDLDLSNYLDHTLAGRNGHGLYGLYHYDTAWGRLRVVALNTVSSGDPLRDSTGYLDGGQVDELIAAMQAEPTPSDQTVVLGHHPAAIDGLSLFNTDDELMRLLAAADAMTYLHGHRHMHLLSWEGDVLFAMARTLGNPGDEGSINRAGFNILAFDDGLAATGVPLDEANVAVAWPVVMITRPADAALGGGNPRATPLPRAAAAQLLRALVFAPGGLPELVQHRVDGGAWQPMVRVGRHYEAWFSTPDAARCELEVQASAQGSVASAVVQVDLQ